MPTPDRGEVWIVDLGMDQAAMMEDAVRRWLAL
jgi:hypothetical protein